jgi:hypothetical protein
MKQVRPRLGGTAISATTFSIAPTSSEEQLIAEANEIGLAIQIYIDRFSLCELLADFEIDAQLLTTPILDS